MKSERRQGYLLSIFLFNLVQNVLLSKVMQEKQIGVIWKEEKNGYFQILLCAYKNQISF